MNAQLRLVTPKHENRSVPVRPDNSALRSREYLTPQEIDKLTKEARQGRYGHRDATLILIAFRHGLRASRFATLNGAKLNLADLMRFMSAGSRMASRPSIHYAAMKFEHCASYAGNSRTRALYLRPNVADRLPRTLAIGL